MRRLTILFEAASGDASKPARQWAEEYLACAGSGSFDVGLFDPKGSLHGGPLTVKSLQGQTGPTILRCLPMDEAAYSHLLEELMSRGYRLITVPSRAYWFFLRGYTGLPAVEYVIPFELPGDAFRLGKSDEAVIYITRDPDAADVELSIAGNASPTEADEFAKLFARTRGSHCTGHVFFERQLKLQMRQGWPVGWRIFYYDALPFYGAPFGEAAL